MSDCSNATMRDRLPDLLHERLAAAQRAEVRAHLDACSACLAEFQLLILLRAASDTPSVDAARIVAALPRYRKSSSWQRAVHSPMLRVAAAIVLLAGGAGVGIGVANRRAAVVPSQDGPATAVFRPATTEIAPATTLAQPGSANGSAELAMGEMLDDLSDSDLRALLDVVAELDAMTPTETEIVVPAVSRGGA